MNRTNTCLTLRSIYGEKVSLPSSVKYATIAPENWSESAQLFPSCTFEPTSAQDVGGALAVLVRDKAKFAVRGGGHMPTPGASNIEDGVLISLDRMRTMQLTNHDTIAQLGPGLRWLDVYSRIKDYGLGVSGGRFAPVGVPGLLLGGGISFFGSRYGWASNQVSNYEVVLSNSSIALKGGSGNFGIVTRFDVKTFPLREVYGGQSTFAPQYLSIGSDDVDSSYGPTVNVDLGTGTITLLGVCLHAGPDPDPDPAAFANFTRIPTLSTNNRVWPSLADALGATAVNGDRSQRQLFMATATKASPESVRLANETFFELMDKMMPELEKVQNLTLRLSPQHISKSYLEAARRSGGDPMDVEPGIGIYIGSAWDNEEDDKIVHKFGDRFISTLNSRSKARGIDYPFVYLNDADPSEKPFKLYGQGKSLKKLRDIRDKYDRNHHFQKLLPGGFKL
ncbi:hypothetical protein GGS20DRAFT_578438 [Poronia punctata]|nr:hypothetical protein GGS20DRAFT_578438 [Poronia punctata]